MTLGQSITVLALPMRILLTQTCSEADEEQTNQRTSKGLRKSEVKASCNHVFMEEFMLNLDVP